MGNLFSIIVPTYNSAQTLSATLKSILTQDFTQYEVIVIDGYSKDDTVKIAKEYNDQRIRIISEPDKGIYDAMNKGLALAQGEWVYFLGSDDTLFDKDVLSDVKSFLSGKQVDILYGNVLINGNSGWAKDGDVYDGKFTFRKLFKKNICHQSIFYRRKFMEDNQLFFNIRYAVRADWDLNLKSWLITKFVYFDRIVARFNAGGASTQKEIVDPFVHERKLLYQKYYKEDIGDRVRNLINRAKTKLKKSWL